MTLAIFDLDHTLLSGDSDDLWCRFLVEHGLLPPAQLQQNDTLGAAYRTGSVSVTDFCAFHAATLTGGTPASWAPWCERFLQEQVLPRIPDDAWQLLDRHRRAGHTLMISTATHRVITARTAHALGVPNLIATEVELLDGHYTGRNTGVPNMREGKVQRLHMWLAEQGLPAATLATAHFYSDSINDLPLLAAVGHAVAVDPDDRLLAEARARGWPVLHFRRPG